MRQKSVIAFFIFAFIILISACDSALPSKHPSGGAGRGVVNAGPVTNAWTAPTVLAEWTTTDFNSAPDFEIVSAGADGQIAAWTNAAGQLQFSRRTSSSGPWESTGPDLTRFKTVFSPHLYSNPESSTVFATWYSPDQGLGANFISRYTPQAGWTTPRAFSNTTGNTKVIVGSNGEAVILWQTQAENGTIELNARRFDAQGALGLLDTYIFGQPGRSAAQFVAINGRITSSGDAELYLVSEDLSPPGPGSYYGYYMIWNIHYKNTGKIASTWSAPRIIPNSRLELNAYSVSTEIVATGSDDFRFIAKGFGSQLTVFEVKSGIWQNTTPDPPSPAVDRTLSTMAIGPSGDFAMAWLDVTRRLTPEDLMTIETRVFFIRHDLLTGWSTPIQINNSTPILHNPAAEGPGFGPEIRINSKDQIAVTWFDPADAQVKVHSNFYDPATGWGGEELAATTSVKWVQMRRFVFTLDDAGHSSAFWQHATFGLGGLTTVRLQTIDRSGPGSGVAIAKTAQSGIALVTAGSEFFSGPSAQPLAATDTAIVTPQQRINRLRASTNPQPIHVSSAWDEPTTIDVLTNVSTLYSNASALKLTSNKLGEALVSYTPIPYRIDPAKSRNILWSGDILKGGWHTDSPPNPVSTQGQDVTGVVVEPRSGDFYLSWVTYCGRGACGTACSGPTCSQVFVSRKTSNGPWEAPSLLGDSAGRGLQFLVSSVGVSAVWISSMDSLGNPQLSYSEHNRDTGWSVADSFSPELTTPTIGTLSHDRRPGLSPVMSQSGVLSAVAGGFDNASLSPPVLVQRDPIKGWHQTDFPALSSDTLKLVDFLNATGTGDSVQAIGKEMGVQRVSPEMSYQFEGGKWGPQQDFTAPTKGNIFGDRSGEFLPKARNSRGQLLVAWYENIGSGAQEVRQLRVNLYDPTRGWGKPTDIGYPISGTWSHTPGIGYESTVSRIRVSINDSGQGAVAWVDASSITQTLKIIHVDATMSKIDHEIVLSLDAANAWIRELEVLVDSQGRTILVWDETSSGLLEDTHRIKTTTHHAAGTISPQPIVPPIIPPPAAPIAPKQSAGWSDKETAAHRPYPTNGLPVPQQIGIGVAGNMPIIAIQSNQTAVVSPSPGLWSEQDPYGSATPNSIAATQLVTDESSRAVYALWASQNSLYMNRHSTTGTWAQPVLVANNSDTGYLLVNRRGQVAVAWEASDSPNALTITEVTTDATGAIKVNAGTSSTLSASALLGKPILSNQGTVAALRAVSGVTGPTYVLSRYDYGKGWQAPTNRALDLSLVIPSSLQLAVASNNQVIAFAQSDTLRTLHSSVLRTDGSWGAWTSLQKRNGFPISLAGQYRIGTSSAGHVYATWVEEIIGVDGEPVNNVMFSSSSIVDITTSNPWKAPTLISQITHSNFNETPLFLVGQNGAAAIIWKQTVTPMESEALMVKKYVPSTGWATAPEIAAGFDLYVSSGPTHLNGQVSASNSLYIVWETTDTNIYGLTPAISLTRGGM